MTTLKRTLVWITWFVVLAAVAAGAYRWWQKQRPADKPPYTTTAVDRGDITATVTATGTMSAVTTVQVGSQVSGIIAKLYADFNSRVQQGQLLAELDPTTYEAMVAQRRADVTQAEVNLANTEAAFKRQEKLLSLALAAQSDYDSAKAAYGSAQAMLAQSRAALVQSETNLKFTKIVSPIEGVVVARQYDIGQTVAASFQAPTLFTIAQDLTKMQVKADVDQSDIGRIQVGSGARFTVDAFPDQDFRGRVTQIRLNATVNQNVITYPVIIELDNPGERLRPNMTADVSFDVATARASLRVPNAALRYRPPEGAVPAKKDAAPGPGTASAAASQAPGTAPASGAASAAKSQATAPTGERSERGNHGSWSGNRGGGEGGGRPSGGWPGAGGPGGGGDGKRRVSHEQTVYVLNGKDLKAVRVKTGISDGRYTEISSGELKEGDLVVTGQPTTKADTSQQSRPPGPRMF